MKVLHISSPKTWRGGEQQLIYLVEELKELGIDQVVMCPFNSEVHRYCLKHHLNHVTYFKRFSANPMVAYRVNHVCSREKIDLIHVHDSHAHNFAILSAVLTKNKLPIVVSRRVDFPVQDTSMSHFKYNHAQINRLICVSKAIKEVMEPSINDKSKLAVVHSGVDARRFKGVVSDGRLREEFNIPADYVLIGNVSALAPHKDYPTFIATAKSLIQGGLKAKFLAVGEGPSRKEVIQAIKDSEMEEHIILCGFREDIPVVLRELDLFLMTSTTEGLGTSLIDALASELPIVATNAGGVGEIIQNQVNGMLCKVGSVDQLAGAVRILLSDQEMQQRFKASGLETLANFAKSLTAQKTLDIYKEDISSESAE